MCSKVVSSIYQCSFISFRHNPKLEKNVSAISINKKVSLVVFSCGDLIIDLSCQNGMR